MASLHSLSVGQYEEFSRQMAKAGLEAEDVQLVLRQPLLAKDMVAALRNSVRIATEYLRSPHQQMERIRRFNDKYWQAITDEEFAEAYRKLDEALVRIRRDPQVQRLDDLLVVQFCFGSTYLDAVRWGQAIKQFDPQELSIDFRKAEFDTPFHYERGFYLHRVNLVANVGFTPQQAEGRLAQAEALVAIAMHPELVVEEYLLRGIVIGHVSVKANNCERGLLRIGSMAEPNLALMHQEADRSYYNFPIPTNLGYRRLTRVRAF